MNNIDFENYRSRVSKLAESFSWLSKLESPVENFGGVETTRMYQKRHESGFYWRFCRPVHPETNLALGLEIGGMPDPLFLPDYPNCFTFRWEYDKLGDGSKLEGIPDEGFDYVYSSHCGEHVPDYRVAVSNWMRVVKPKGHLIIVLPSYFLYERSTKLPSRYNLSHLRFFSQFQRIYPDVYSVYDETKAGLKDIKHEFVFMNEEADGNTNWDKPFDHGNGAYNLVTVVKKL